MAKKKKTKKQTKPKNVLLANQKQVVNVFAQHQPRAQSRNRLPKQEGQIVRHIYQNIPIFNPLPYQPQPVGTISEANTAIHALIKSNTEQLRKMTEQKPARVNFLDVGADDTTMRISTIEPSARVNFLDVGADDTTVRIPPSTIHQRSLSTPRYMDSTIASSGGTNLFDELNATTASARTDEADGGGGTIRYKKNGDPAMKPGPKKKM